MKVSLYNILTEREDGSALLFNSLSGTFVLLDKSSYDMYKQMADTELIMNESVSEEHAMVIQLKRGGFFVENDVNELEYLKQRYENMKSSTSTLRLYIVPTSVCNFACKYCYFSSEGKAAMTEEVQDALLEFVRKRIGNRKELSVVWTGGEPTLVPDVITHLSKGFMEIANERGIAYNSAIFTNGYLLNRDMAELLHAHGVKTAQIVVDGPREVHDGRRPLIGDSGTYDVIMKNLKDISSILNIAVRINLDSTNAATRNISILLDSLKQCVSPESTVIELAQVVSYTSQCHEFVKKHGLKRTEFADKLFELYPLVYESGFSSKFTMSAPINVSSCSADSGFGISEKGDIYKCFLLMGEEHECVGNLLTVGDPVEDSENYMKWNKWSPFSKKSCQRCNMLPICLGGGGCPIYDVAQDGYLREDICCMPEKIKIEEAMEFYYRLQQRRRIVGNAV